MSNQQSIYHVRKTTIEGPSMDVITTNQENANPPTPSTDPTPAPTPDIANPSTEPQEPTTTVDTSTDANKDVPSNTTHDAPKKDCKYCSVDKIIGLALKGTAVLVLMAFAYFLVKYDPPKPSK